MRTIEEIEKEKKLYEKLITENEMLLENENTSSHFINTTKEIIARLDASIIVLKWVLGESNE